MKKILLSACFGMMITAGAFAQPVSDRAVVPVAVTLNQILRLHVIDGGNIEFVFNTIEQYKMGIVNSTFYDTRFVVASSTDWQLWFGAEDATLMGTDQDNQNLVAQNTMPLDNVGFTLEGIGTYGVVDIAGAGEENEMAAVASDYDLASATANGLEQYPGAVNSPLIQPGTANGGPGNGGDIEDNDFIIHWECGTQQVGSANMPMNANSLLTQNLPPDRYVTNVLLDIESLPN